MPTAWAGERIRTVRKLFGLTQEALAEGADVSQSLISHVERGLRDATDDLIQAIAAATMTPLSFFDVVPDELPLDSLRFRKLATASRKDTDRASVLFREAFRIASALADTTGYPTPDIPIAQGDLDHDDIEDLADETREALRLAPDGPVPHATRALERAGIPVAPIVFPDVEPSDSPAAVGHYGLSYWAGPRGRALIAFFPGSKPDRDRFTLAHELGHIVLHSLRRTVEDPEKEATRFAAAFLMPRRRAETIFEPRLVLTDYARIKAVWGISIQALIMRSSQLGIIDSQRVRSLFTQLNARGWRKNEPVTVHPEEPLLLWRLLTARYGFNPYRHAVHDLAIPPMILSSLIPKPVLRQTPDPALVRPTLRRT